MKTTLLEDLDSERIQLMSACLSTASALRDRLRRSDEVSAVREALESGKMTEETVREFVSGLMAELKPGVSFAHDATLSALAVALESMGLPFAEEYLQSLSRLKLAEMGMSIRVARECLKHRLPTPDRAKEAVAAQASLRPATSAEDDGEGGRARQEANGRPEQAP